MFGIVLSFVNKPSKLLFLSHCICQEAVKMLCLIFPWLPSNCRLNVTFDRLLICVHMSKINVYKCNYWYLPNNHRLTFFWHYKISFEIFLKNGKVSFVIFSWYMSKSGKNVKFDTFSTSVRKPCKCHDWQHLSKKSQFFLHYFKICQKSSNRNFWLFWVFIKNLKILTISLFVRKPSKLLFLYLPNSCKMFCLKCHYWHLSNSVNAEKNVASVKKNIWCSFQKTIFYKLWHTLSVVVERIIFVFVIVLFFFHCR